MKREIIENILVFIGIILFDFLFWQQGMGFNVFLFTLFLILALFKIYPEGKHSKVFLITVAGTWVLSILIVIHNSTLSKVMYIFSSLFMVGFAKQHTLRFLLFGFLLSLREIFASPLKAFKRIHFSSSKNTSLFKMIGLSILPLIFVVIFFLLYYTASPRFADFMDRLGNGFSQLFFTGEVSLRWLFWCFALMLIGGALWRPSKAFFQKAQANLSEELLRKKNKHQLLGHSILALKTEYQIALIGIFSLNALLLVVNFLDVPYVWYAYKGITASDLSRFVHEGTYALIASILLAMGILTYFFRKNLHFFPNGHLLKTAAYIWLAQNALLVLSVGVRNIRYVDYFGLAYKRIGVFIFLILVISGLFLMYLKIKKNKSIYFLFNRNTWIAYVVLILASFVNWDIAISAYNIHVHQKSSLDTHFLFHQMSDKNLYLLEKNKQEIAIRSAQSIESVERSIERKKRRFKYKNKNKTWQEWNYIDYRNMLVTEK